MPVVACPKCRRQYQIQGDPTGKAMKCPACQTVFRPGAAAAPAQPAVSREQQERQRAEQEAMDVAVPSGVPAQLFPDEPLPPNVDPLSNHVVADPGFAEVDLEEIRYERERNERGRLANAMDAGSSMAQMQEEEEKKRRSNQDSYLSSYNLFDFNGRISRKTFWLSSLSYGAVVMFLLLFYAIAFGVTLQALDIDIPKPGEPIGDSLGIFLVNFVVMLVFGFVGTWVSLALHSKRYHDLGYSGWRILIGFIPIVGGIWVFVECGFFPGTPGRNPYGQDPIKAREQRKRELEREKAEKGRR